MELGREEIEIKGIVYECFELPLTKMMPLIEKEGAHIGLELLKVAVKVDGKLLGGQLDSIGFRTGRQLLKVVHELNGLNDEEKS